MRSAALRGVALAIAAITGLSPLAACGDDGDGDGGGEDMAAFCASVDRLAENDPFAELALASPQEMRVAFDQLRDGVASIAEDAPRDLESRTGRYLDTVDELIDQLRGAGFDPRQLDTLRYRSAAGEYEKAAISVENAAAQACP